MCDVFNAYKLSLYYNHFITELQLHVTVITFVVYSVLCFIINPKSKKFLSHSLSLVTVEHSEDWIANDHMH